jgi:hypothetical protein
MDMMVFQPSLWPRAICAARGMQRRRCGTLPRLMIRAQNACTTLTCVQRRAVM